MLSKVSRVLVCVALLGLLFPASGCRPRRAYGGDPVTDLAFGFGFLPGFGGDEYYDDFYEDGYYDDFYDDGYYDDFYEDDFYEDFYGDDYFDDDFFDDDDYFDDDDFFDDDDYYDDWFDDWKPKKAD